MERVVVQKKSMKVPLEAGKVYYYCDCGRSRNQPFCDGSHEGTIFSPIAFTVDQSKVYSMCACKYTKKKPYCDGSHRRIDW